MTKSSHQAAPGKGAAWLFFAMKAMHPICRLASVEHQVAVRFNPRIQADIAVPQRHGTARIHTWRIPRDVIIRGVAPVVIRQSRPHTRRTRVIVPGVFM